MKNSDPKQSFGLFAQDYQKYRRSYDRKPYDLLFSLLPQKDLAVLDIGCGTGKSTEPLLEFAKQKILVTGVDPDERMLHEARLSAEKKKLPIEYVQAAAENLPFATASFDAIISGAAFHWFGSKPTIEKIRALLRENGVFLVFWIQYVTMDKPTIGSEVYKKYKWKGIPKEFREQEFVSALLSESGFKNVKKETFSFSEKRALPEIIGNFKTNSSYAALSVEMREQFVEEMTEAYKIALDGKEYDENDLELRVCYGFA